MSGSDRALTQKKKIRWLIGGTIVVVAILAMSMLNFGDSLVYFYTPSEAFAKAGELSAQTIKLGGMVQNGSKQWHADQVLLTFTLTDLKGHDIQVSHKGSPPDLFKEGQGVVCEGKIDPSGKSFVAQKLMVKHSEEYKKEEDHSNMNRALLEESIFKNEGTSKK